MYYILDTNLVSRYACEGNPGSHHLTVDPPCNIQETDSWNVEWYWACPVGLLAVVYYRYVHVKVEQAFCESSTTFKILAKEWLQKNLMGDFTNFLGSVQRFAIIMIYMSPNSLRCWSRAEYQRMLQPMEHLLLDGNHEGQRKTKWISSLMAMPWSIEGDNGSLNVSCSLQASNDTVKSNHSHISPNLSASIPLGGSIVYIICDNKTLTVQARIRGDSM